MNYSELFDFEIENINNEIEKHNQKINNTIKECIQNIKNSSLKQEEVKERIIDIKEFYESELINLSEKEIKNQAKHKAVSQLLKDKGLLFMNELFDLKEYHGQLLDGRSIESIIIEKLVADQKTKLPELIINNFDPVNFNEKDNSIKFLMSSLPNNPGHHYHLAKILGFSDEQIPFDSDKKPELIDPKIIRIIEVANYLSDTFKNALIRNDASPEALFAKHIQRSIESNNKLFDNNGICFNANINIQYFKINSENKNYNREVEELLTTLISANRGFAYELNGYHYYKDKLREIKDNKETPKDKLRMKQFLLNKESIRLLKSAFGRLRLYNKCCHSVFALPIQIEDVGFRFLINFESNYGRMIEVNEETFSKGLVKVYDTKTISKNDSKILEYQAEETIRIKELSEQLNQGVIEYFLNLSNNS